MITFTAEQLNSLSPELLAQIILEQQRQLEQQTEQIRRLSDHMERLVEQIRIAMDVCCAPGRQTERPDSEQHRDIVPWGRDYKREVCQLHAPEQNLSGTRQE